MKLNNINILILTEKFFYSVCSLYHTCFNVLNGKSF